jgi:hypothetical protein
MTFGEDVNFILGETIFPIASCILVNSMGFGNLGDDLVG